MADHPGKAALAAIMEAAGASTREPWRLNERLIHDGQEGDKYEATICGDIFILATIDGPAYEHQSRNARFIVVARNNIASVAAYVADLEAERDAAKAENERLRKALTMPDADRRQWRLAELIATVGHFNGSDLRRDFGISIPQASADIKRFIVNHPHVAKYDRTLKMYVRAALGGDNG